MTVYTVKAVRELANGTSEKTGKAWTRQKVRLVSNGEITDAQMFCGQFVPVPKEGDNLDGTIEPPTAEGRLPEFKPARRGAPGGFRGPREDDPRTRAEIRRMAAHKQALELVRLGLETSLLTKPENFGDLLTSYYQQVGEVADDVKKAGDAA